MTVTRWSYIVNKFRVALIVALVAGILAGGVLIILRHNTFGGSVEIVLPTPAEEIEVYVSGEVSVPGVYALPQGSRVADAIETAGGFGSDADLSAINLARVVRNGEHVHVYGKDESSQRIDINTADVWLLEALPGIGEATAQRIIDYRTENGPFQSVEDLKNVKGIGESTLEKLKDKITVH